MPDRIWVGLNRHRSRTAHARGEDSVAADIRAHINEQIPMPQQVQHEAHARILVEPAIDITGSAGHAIADDEFGALNPVDDNILLEATADLPLEIAHQRR